MANTSAAKLQGVLSLLNTEVFAINSRRRLPLFLRCNLYSIKTLSFVANNNSSFRDEDGQRPRHTAYRAVTGLSSSVYLHPQGEQRQNYSCLIRSEVKATRTAVVMVAPRKL